MMGLLGELYEYVGGPRDGAGVIVHRMAQDPLSIRVEHSGGSYVPGVFLDRAGDVHRVLVWEQDWHPEEAK